MSPARETTWTLRGQRFAALEWGEPPSDPADPPPTILLHGFLDHAGAWTRIAPALDGWRIALDQRGHGRSAWAAEAHGYFFPEYLADLDALVHAVGRPVRLVGHSMGGTVATMYAGARPDRVTALASVDGLGLYDQVDEVVWRMEAFLDGVLRPPVARTLPSVEAAAARILATHGPMEAAWAHELAERGTTPVGGEDGGGGGVRWSYDPRHRSRGALPYRHSQHRPLLARIRCPVLSIHPATPTFRPADVAALESEVADLRRVVIPGTTHMIHLQAPGALASALGAFFAP